MTSFAIFRISLNVEADLQVCPRKELFTCHPEGKGIKLMSGIERKEVNWK